MIDPRLSIIDKRLGQIRRILVLASGKGGVGKSLCSSVTALLLAKQGFSVGLLDLDFHGASAHIFLNVKPTFPEESNGILPLRGDYDLKFMSIAAFTGEKGVPLRGGEITDALLELLAVTQWGQLDFLVVDMPPGIGDEVLDLIRFIPQGEIIIVTSTSTVSVRVVKRLLDILLELSVSVRGVLVNMALPYSDQGIHVESFPEVPNFGPIPFFPELENYIGKTTELVNSAFAEELNKTISTVVKDPSF